MRFIDIYECIIKHYPLGLNEIEPIYHEYSGFKLLQEMCHEKYNLVKLGLWEKLLIKLNSSFPSSVLVNDQTGNTEPSYTCVIVLSKTKLGEIIHLKEIHLHVSILGSFYTAYGVDTILIQEGHKYPKIETQPILTVSPFGSYESIIPLVRSIIEDVYFGFSYVPFYLLKKRVKSLSIAGINTMEDNGASIFQALFTSADVANYKLRGDINYE